MSLSLRQRQTGTLSLALQQSIHCQSRLLATTTHRNRRRRWKLSVAIMREGYPPTGSDWKEMCQSRIDIIEWSGDQINITGHGKRYPAGFLDRDRPIRFGRWDSDGDHDQSMKRQPEPRLYDTLHAGEPQFPTNLWTQQKGTCFRLHVEVASKAGAVLRFRYDSTNLIRPTPFNPDRTATPGNEVSGRWGQTRNHGREQ